jgi:hypothetical protein
MIDRNGWAQIGLFKNYTILRFQATISLNYERYELSRDFLAVAFFSATARYFLSARCGVRTVVGDIDIEY